MRGPKYVVEKGKTPVLTAEEEACSGLSFIKSLPAHNLVDNVPLLVHTGAVGRANQNPEVPVRFCRTEAGGSPVLDWLRGLDKDDRQAIGLDLMRVQFGWPIGRPLVGSLKDGLWEVRSSLPSQRIARLILCFHDEMLVVLHGFIKKTQKTPADDLALAKRRMKEVTK